MTTPWDEFIGAIEKRKQQLDEVLESYREFRQKLDSLPPEIAHEAEKMLAASHKAKPSEGTGKSKDLTGKTALECVRIILTERHNEPTHFSVIAKEAIKRGYKGRITGSPEQVESRTISSFWAAMSRSEELEATGKGLYRLREWPQ